MRFAVQMAVFGLLSNGAYAQAPAPSTGWTVDYGATECTLARRFGADGRSLFAIKSIPGAPQLTLVVVNPPARAEARPDGMALSPGTAALPGTPTRAQVVAGATHEHFLDRATVLADMSAARSLVVSEAGAPVYEVPLSGIGKAAAALRTCEATLLRTWGLDPDALAALRSAPRSLETALIKAADYSDGDLQKGAQGDVLMRIDVTAAGRPSGCAVLVGSGHASLDRRTCDLVRRRARYAPAIGADGRPTAAPVVLRVSWRMFPA